MADIKPFRGVIFNTDKAGAIKGLVAPPYDIISPEEQQELLAASPFNVVRLILPEDPADKTPAWQEKAHATFEEWKQRDLLHPSSREAVYFYRQTFDLPDATRRARTAFISLYKLEELGIDGIYPHEETFPLVIQEQLALLRACSASFSQIFTLFDDDAEYHSWVDEWALPASTHIFSFMDDKGIEHDLWELSDTTLLEELRTYMSGRRIFIADGHHRYETSLLYMEEKRVEAPGGAEQPCDFISMSFIGLNDPGLVLLPVHRLLRCESLSPADIVEKLQGPCELTRVEGADHAARVHKAWSLTSLGEPTVFGLVTPEDVYLVSAKGGWDISADERHSREWNELDVTILHRIVMERYLDLGPHGTSGVPYDIRYTVDLNEVIAATSSGNETGFLARSPALPVAWKIAAAGEKMPHKSTYFYPKMPSGLVIYDHETR